jgi:predicted nucleic acid-binding protein
MAADPTSAPRRSPDPGDDYLLALAEAEKAVLVSGDRHLLGLDDRFPIQAPRAFLQKLARAG